tara:strand:- start:385 stop:630 length:246 start_codon:yes stop_codon:yes gene_type:complete
MKTKRETDYYVVNKEQIKIKYYLNRELILEDRKAMYLKNNESLCCRACKTELTKWNFKAHCKTKKHNKNIILKKIRGNLTN